MRRFGFAMFAAVLVLSLTVGSAYADCGKCAAKAGCQSAEQAAPACAGCNKACAPKAEKACGGCQKACKKVCAHRLHCVAGGGQHFNLKKDCQAPCEGKCTSCKCEKACDQAHLCGEPHKKGDDHHQCCKVSLFFGWHHHGCCGCNNHRGACAKPAGECACAKVHGWYKCDHRHVTASEATVR